MKEPLFEEIKRFIKQQIDEKVYKVGDKIPTEMEFSKIFNTSRQTANKALRDLVLEDIVERFPRSGTFVKQKVSQTSILELKNISKEIKDRGNIYSNELISLKEIRADEVVSKTLHVVKDQIVYVSKMIHKENGVPVRFDIRYVRPASAPEYIHQDFMEFTPSQYLQKECPVEKVQNTIEALLCKEDIQSLLDISKNEPCLLISRVVTSSNQIASYSNLYYPSSRYKLNSTFTS